ncbi:hypothetical protein Salat_2139900 [Sesamum alatum]|uniref:CCHC-type domain-containing protein n=1 Tax=Sesamum alatum TaxID=300844 RepID=A0AAE2CH16_9LAMI|nr:hypothetical protein Salat_2139900 [Sesamum alatum]
MGNVRQGCTTGILGRRQAVLTHYGQVEQVSDDNGNGREKNGKKFRKKEKAKEVVTETVEPRVVQDRPKAGCYICSSTEHRMRDCPKRGKLNALVAKQTDDELEIGSMWITSMHVGALRVQSRACRNSCTKGLLLVKDLVAGEEVKAVVDTGAMHSLILDRIIKDLGLDVKPCGSVLKAVNSKVVLVSRITTTDLCIGSWKGECDLVAVGLDDFDVILGSDFFVSAQVTIDPWLDGIYIAKCKHPRFVRGVYGKGDTPAGKKLRMVKSVPSSCSSPYVVGFYCIGKMREETRKRWAEVSSPLHFIRSTFQTGSSSSLPSAFRLISFHCSILCLAFPISFKPRLHFRPGKEQLRPTSAAAADV